MVLNYPQNRPREDPGSRRGVGVKEEGDAVCQLGFIQFAKQ